MDKGDSDLGDQGDGTDKAPPRADDGDQGDQASKECRFPPEIEDRRQEIRDRLDDPTTTEAERDRLVEQYHQLDRQHSGCEGGVDPPQVDAQDTDVVLPDGRPRHDELPKDPNKTIHVRRLPDGSREVTVETTHRDQNTDLAVVDVDEAITTTEIRRYDKNGTLIGFSREESASANFNSHNGRDQIGVDCKISGEIDGPAREASISAGCNATLTHVTPNGASHTVRGTFNRDEGVGQERPIVDCEDGRCWLDIPGVISIEGGKEPGEGYSLSGSVANNVSGSYQYKPQEAKRP